MTLGKRVTGTRIECWLLLCTFCFHIPYFLTEKLEYLRNTGMQRWRRSFNFAVVGLSG